MLAYLSPWMVESSLIFIASWWVKLLLEKGYTVKGTVRNPDDPKNAHLKAMKGAAERLILCKADHLDFAALREAIDGCQDVFHTASAVTYDPKQMVEPAVSETRYVFEAAADAGTVRVRSTLIEKEGETSKSKKKKKEKEKDNMWSNLFYCKPNEILWLKPKKSNSMNYYLYNNSLDSSTRTRSGTSKPINMVSKKTDLVLGPLLRPTLNASAMHVMKYLDCSARKNANAVQGYADVLDVAEAHALVYEEAEGAPGSAFSAPIECSTERTWSASSPGSSPSIRCPTSAQTSSNPSPQTAIQVLEPKAGGARRGVHAGESQSLRHREEQSLQEKGDLANSFYSWITEVRPGPEGSPMIKCIGSSFDCFGS
uniref:NAD-dependent epimerase/dehydratase domain-containing protein n=1 Tax=Musa acuminata subsp. malaccensis TaxID=214687 RepID=A0A804JWC7_MUSAM